MQAYPVLAIPGRYQRIIILDSLDVLCYAVKSLERTRALAVSCAERGLTAFLPELMGRNAVKPRSAHDPGHVLDRIVLLSLSRQNYFRSDKAMGRIHSSQQADLI